MCMLLQQYFLLFSDALIPEWLSSSLLLFYLALRSLMIRLKWISSSVSGLFRSQDRWSIFTIYFFSSVPFVQFTPLLQRLKWYSLHFLLIFMEVWSIMPGGLLKSLTESCGITCVSFLEMWKLTYPNDVIPNDVILFFVFLFSFLPKHKTTCLCHSNSVSHFFFYFLLNSQEKNLGRIERQCFICLFLAIPPPHPFYFYSFYFFLFLLSLAQILVRKIVYASLFWECSLTVI